MPLGVLEGESITVARRHIILGPQKALCPMLNMIRQLVLLLWAALFMVFGQSTTASPTAGYILGPDDLLTIRVLDLDEFSPQNLPSVRIDPQGSIRVPIAGRIQAAGLTVEQLEFQLAHRLSVIMNDPEVTVAVTEFGSHPVSVLGAVKNPGVYQISDRKSLFEVLSMAGGLAPDAGNAIKITRRTKSGTLALPRVVYDPTGEFLIGKVNIREAMEARSPHENIDVLSNDVITVPRADLIYVIGAVRRSGGFVLSEKEQISVLQALSLAEGLASIAASSNARILRQTAPGTERAEVPVDVKKILEGRAKDVALQANDILFVPTSASKNASLRAVEAAIQIGTGVAIFRR